MPSPKHTPYLDGQGGVKIGLSPIAESSWLELDDKFEQEINFKNMIKKDRELYEELGTVYLISPETVKATYLSENLLMLPESWTDNEHFTENPQARMKLKMKNDTKMKEFYSLMAKELNLKED